MKIQSTYYCYNLHALHLRERVLLRYVITYIRITFEWIGSGTRVQGNKSYPTRYSTSRVRVDLGYQIGSGNKFPGLDRVGQRLAGQIATPSFNLLGPNFLNNFKVLFDLKTNNFSTSLNSIITYQICFYYYLLLLNLYKQSF